MDKPKKSRKERNNSRPSDDEKVIKDKKKSQSHENNDKDHKPDKPKKSKDEKGSKSKDKKDKKGKSKDKEKKSKSDKHNKLGDEEQNGNQQSNNERKITEDIGFDEQQRGSHERKSRSGSKMDKDKQQQFLNNKVHPGSKRNKEKIDTVMMHNLETARSAQSNEGEDQNLLDDNEEGPGKNQKTQMSLLQKLQTRGFKEVLNEMVEDVRNYEFFISHSSSFKENWDFLIMITACYNVFMLPIGIAFRVDN